MIASIHCSPRDMIWWISLVTSLDFNIYWQPCQGWASLSGSEGTSTWCKVQVEGVRNCARNGYSSLIKLGDRQLVNACRFLWRHLSIVQKGLHALPTITSPYSEAPTNFNWTLPMNPPIHQHRMSTLQQVIMAVTILGHTVVDTENL